MNRLAYILISALCCINILTFGKAPEQDLTKIEFIQNRGQVTDQYYNVRTDIDAKINNGNITLFVGSGKLQYQWTNKGGHINDKQDNIEIYRLDVILEGANTDARALFDGETRYKEHYYLSSCGVGVTASGYSKVVYKNIYKNIDWVLYVSSDGTDRMIKYDFIVNEGGDVSNIRIRYAGATELLLDNGELVVTTPFGEVREHRPYCYLQQNSKEVASHYILEGNELSFQLSDYGVGNLIIDPLLTWSSYYGNDITPDGLSVETDIYDNVYLCGTTSSISNIATTGAFQTSIAGNIDGYLVKFDSSGARLWATYYGTGGTERLMSLACDKDGNIYAVGNCDSNAAKSGGLVTSGAHQTGHGGDDDAFLVKFSSSGLRIWSTLYGGTGAEFDGSVACDPYGNVFLAGGTGSNNNIATSGTHKTSVSANDAYLVKFNGAGTRLWGSYYGGSTGTISPWENFYSITCDGNGNVYGVGVTGSSNGVATTGAHQTSIGGNWDGFLAKFSGNNGSLLWGTYYGGSSYDAVLSVCTDANDNVYIGGQTHSNNNIATTGVYKSISTGVEAFITKFNSAGVRQWGSYFGGGNSNTGVSGISADVNGRIYFTGCVSNSTSVATTNAHQSTYGGGNADAYLAVFTPTAQLNYGTYFGGSGHEYHQSYGLNDNPRYGKCLALSNSGKLYIGGLTQSSNNIATSGVHQTSFIGTGGSYNAFLAAFETDTVVFIPQRYTDTVWCPGDTVRIVYGVNQPFRTGNAFAVELSNATGGFTSPVNIGSHNANTGDTITCVIPMNTPAGTGYRIRIIADSPGRVSWDNQWDIRINSLPANLVAGSNSPVCTGDTLHLTGSSTNTGITWLWTGPNSFSSGAKDSFIANAQLIDSGKYILKATLNSTGCSLTDTTTVEMRLTPAKPTAGSNSPVCEFYSVQLTTSSSTSGVSYSWSGPGSYSSSTQNPTVTTSASSIHAGDYISTVTLNGCSNRDTTTVVILPKPSTPIAGASNSPLCARQDLQLTASNITGGSYAWYGPSAFTANTQNPVRANIQMGDAGAYYVYATVSGCISDTDSVVVTVNTDPFVNIFPTPGASICQGKQVIFTAVPTNGGTTSYSWLVNGIATGGTGTTYSTTTLNNGDAVSCAMTSTGTCATPFIDTSNAITMTVQPILSPTVTMTADNMPPWNGGLTVTFTANPTHGGSNPEYQWKRNGVDVSGATGPTWGVVVNALNPNEDICVLLKSSYKCAVPDTAMSNCITTAFTGVGDIVHDKNIKIYPNPTSTILHVEGVEAGSTIELIDVLGRKCAISQLLNGSMDVSALVPGVYVVKVNGVVAGRVVKE